MTMNSLTQQLDASSAKPVGMFVAGVVVASVAFMLFTNSSATAHQTDPLRGSGEVLRGSLMAPGAVQALSDVSVPEAAEALRSLAAEQTPAVDAPTF